MMKRGVFFGEAMPLAEERTLRYGQEKQRSVIKKVAFAAQRLASKHALTPKSVGPELRRAAPNAYLCIELF
ncbi:MAG: hypothetical protein KDD09_05920 [Phaeodactylibacter sp.]|nr:hypothetical protein [Phaeodactylibacter sp.]